MRERTGRGGTTCEVGAVEWGYRAVSRESCGAVASQAEQARAMEEEVDLRWINTMRTTCSYWPRVRIWLAERS